MRKPKTDDSTRWRKVSVILIAIGTTILIFAFLQKRTPISTPQSGRYRNGQIISGKLNQSQLKSDKYWQKVLTPQQYNILRQAGTEIPFTGPLLHNMQKGTYYSVGCNEPVFRSEQKYDSGTGWPSFWAPISSTALVLREDESLPGEKRIEVLDQCGGHLGHLFNDGPAPTYLRYCMNSASLYFVPDKK